MRMAQTDKIMNSLISYFEIQIFILSVITAKKYYLHHILFET